MLLAATLLTSSLSFTPVEHAFPAVDKNLRQWDSPVIADLDQDGFPDLLLNDHGFSIRVMWNNSGQYQAPYDLIMGDMHGVSVGDINQDGQLEIVISRGGGSGSNARNTKIFTVSKNRHFSNYPDQQPELALMRGRTVKLVDLDNDGDLDLINFAFPSRGKKGKSENYIYENRDGNLTLASTISASSGDGQKVLVTDFDQDNRLDILMYGHQFPRLFQNIGGFNFSEVSSDIFDASKLSNVTSIAELDVDNDGDMDLFLTRGQSFTRGDTFFDKENKRFAYYTKRGKFDFNGIKGGDVLNFVNIQSQWPHKNVYLGESGYEYIFPGETHSGRELRLVNSDALGFPEKLDKKGTYIGYVGNGNWRIGGDIWSPSTMVVEGVSDYPASHSEGGLTNVLLENKQGKFVKAPQLTNTKLAHSVAVVATDLDNNGFTDLVIRKRGDLIFDNRAAVLLNDNGQFTSLEQHDIVTTELGSVGMGIEAVDFDLDGKMDLVVGNERGKWHLFKNHTGSQHNRFVKIEVGRSPKNKASSLGALVQISGCKNSQIQRVGSSAAQYSLNAFSTIHFGVGQCQSGHKVKVTWSNNETEFVKISKQNTLYRIGKK